MSSENPISADDQQGSGVSALSADAFTPQRLHAELLVADVREIRAYLLGASRDGTFNRKHGTFRISQADERWLRVLRFLLKRLGSRSWIYREGTRNVWDIETRYRLDTPERFDSKRERKGFARGYFDAEGGIPRDPTARFYVQLVQKDLGDLSSVRRALQSLEIRCGRVHNPSVRVDPDYWRFYVLSCSHEDFIAKIGSWHPRKRMLLDQRHARMKI